MKIAENPPPKRDPPANMILGQLAISANGAGAGASLRRRPEAGAIERPDPAFERHRRHRRKQLDDFLRGQPGAASVARQPASPPPTISPRVFSRRNLSLVVEVFDDIAAAICIVLTPGRSRISATPVGRSAPLSQHSDAGPASAGRS
jgi:hypothetical protein